MGWLRSRLSKIVSAYSIGILTGLVFTVGHCANAASGSLDSIPVVGRLENIFHDLKFRLRGVRQPSGDVIVAAYDEKAIKSLGRWPPKRADVARMIERFGELGARAVVFDIAYTDVAFEGAHAAAAKLKSRFEGLSLSSGEGAKLLERLATAQLEASGAQDAAKALGDGSVAARDVKQRIGPVAGALDSAVAELKRLSDMHAAFDAALAKESANRGGDELLAEAARSNPAVVLGSFLLSGPEAREFTAAELLQSLRFVKHMELTPPVVDPSESGGDGTIVSETPVEGVQFHTMAGAMAPLPAMLREGWTRDTNLEAEREKDIALLEAGKQPPRTTIVAFFNTEPDPDGVIRREPLVMAVENPDDPTRPWLFPNIDLAGMLVALGADPASVRLWCSGAASHLDTVAYIPGTRTKALGRTPTRSDYKQIPVDPRARLLLNYYGPDEVFPKVSFAELVDGTVERSRIEGKIVVVGATATGTYDQRVTPFDPISPGVETHATALENMLHEDFLLRPWWALPFECGLLLFVALVFGYLLTRVGVITGLPATLGLALVYFLLDNALFRAGVVVFSATPMIEMATIYVFQTMYRYSTEERQKAHLRRAFQFYLSKDVIEELVNDPSKLKLGGDKAVLSVMFSDIRGFTTISERLSPEQLAKLINEYLTPMTNLVFEHGGTLDKYIGDAVMAIWGAPKHQEDHAYRACKAAVAMMKELEKLQEQWRLEGNNYPPIDIGIGINSGPMVVGNMGGAQRFDYTVLGDNVNLASRLEGTNKDYRSHIIISQNTWDLCHDRVAARVLGAVRVKGKKEPVRIYELHDDKPAAPGSELAQVIERFDAGIAAFRSQKWDEARAKFKSVQELWPKDGPSSAYLEFVAEYEAEPPGADWDGVYTMTHK